MLDLSKHPEPWRVASGPGGALDVVDAAGVALACDVPPGLARAVASLPSLLALLGRCRKLLADRAVLTPGGRVVERQKLLEVIKGLMEKGG